MNIKLYKQESPLGDPEWAARLVAHNLAGQHKLKEVCMVPYRLLSIREAICLSVLLPRRESLNEFSACPLPGKLIDELEFFTSKLSDWGCIPQVWSKGNTQLALVLHLEREYKRHYYVVGTLELPDISKWEELAEKVWIKQAKAAVDDVIIQATLDKQALESRFQTMLDSRYVEVRIPKYGMLEV